MRKLHIIPALLLLLCLPAACGGQVEPVAAAETTTEAFTTTAIEVTAEGIPGTTQEITNDLLDFALLDRLFSMAYADFCREEGRAVEPEGIVGGAYCYFSKYGDSAPFFFDAAGDVENPVVADPENNLLNAVFLKASQLTGRQSIALGELKQWLGGKGIACTTGLSEDGFRFFFEAGKYEIMGDIESEDDSAPIKGFEVFCKSNYS